MKNIFFCEEENEFYTVEFFEKNIIIEWIEFKSGGIVHDQNVKWMDHLPFKVSKTGLTKYGVQEISETEIFLYPFQSGLPFFLRKATLEDVENEIKDCLKWGVSTKYYEMIKEKIAKTAKE